MTSRERVLAAAAGAAVDRKPQISWPKNLRESDVFVYPAGMLAEDRGKPSDSPFPTLALVTNLYGTFQLMGEDIVAGLSNEPGKYADLVEFAEETDRNLCQAAIRNGSLGVFYEIHGATSEECTPMQYGGLFLERDRAFLEAFADAPCNMVYIHGREPYLDFVSDLPAHVFCWDAKGSGIGVEQVRKIRPGALAADDPDADLLLAAGGPISEVAELANV